MCTQDETRVPIITMEEYKKGGNVQKYPFVFIRWEYGVLLYEVQNQSKDKQGLKLSCKLKILIITST